MIMNIYSVLDAKIGSFSNLFLDMTDDSAIRSWSDGVNDSDPKNKWYSHPEDFSLYRLGTFNQDTGHIESVKTLTALVNASALKAMKTVN